MNMSMNKYLRRFRKEEKGSIYTVEFVIIFPMFFVAFMFGFELSMNSIHQMRLDRGLEVTTREIRLNTSKQFTHDTLKKTICANTGGLKDCETNLRLEMIPTNPRTFTSLPASADCINSAQPVSPVRGWSLGQQHDLMLLRACYRYIPMWGQYGLGRALDENGAKDGFAEMVAISAFVQEPR